VSYINVMVKSISLQINVEDTIHKGEKRLKLIFRYNQHIIDIVKKIPGSRWSQTINCWHIPYRENYKEYITGFFGLPVQDEEQPDETHGLIMYKSRNTIQPVNTFLKY
jgi:hypothetical protein